MVSLTPKSRKGGATRRLGKRATKVLTIPELKQSFDAVEAGVKDILKRGDANEKQIKEFQGLWRSIFHRTISKDAAEGYLRVKRGAPVAGPRKTRKSQRGGAALAGAPLDYMTRPGVDGAYGHFPTYQAQGLSFYNSINKDGLFESCGKQDTTPVVPASIGNNTVMKGGAAGSPPPPSLFQGISTYWQGKAMPPSPDPSEAPQLKLV
jgi:hypothetical protein